MNTVALRGRVAEHHEGGFALVVDASDRGTLTVPVLWEDRPLRWSVVLVTGRIARRFVSRDPRSPHHAHPELVVVAQDVVDAHSASAAWRLTTPLLGGTA